MRRLLATLVAAATPALALLAAGPARAADCPGADVVPTGKSLGATRAATLCLLNDERRTRGLKPLRNHRDLRTAAEGFSREMVKHGFFAHVHPVTGSTLTKRVRATDYLADARRWQIAENLAWGSGDLASPARTVEGWMKSAGHRRNILTGAFREIGIGIALGAPQRTPAGVAAATYTTDFGARR